jgi:hypothetical protein
MITFYVATRSCYVLVDANDDAQARALGHPALAALMREQLGREVPIQIHTARPATGDEIELMKWHDGMVARETVPGNC